MNELKPCPFCGEKEIAIYLYEKIYGIEVYKACCTKCSAQFYRGTREELIEAWERRTDDGDD